MRQTINTIAATWFVETTMSNVACHASSLPVYFATTWVITCRYIDQ
jgi:hypothetical protein